MGVVRMSCTMDWILRRYGWNVGTCGTPWGTQRARVFEAGWSLVVGGRGFEPRAWGHNGPCDPGRGQASLEGQCQVVSLVGEVALRGRKQDAHSSRLLTAPKRFLLICSRMRS